MGKEKQKDAKPKPDSNLRELILTKLASQEIDVKTREYSVMTRLSGEYIEILDALVKLEIFKSRSEALAAIVMKTINAEHELYKELKDHAEKLDELQDTVKSLALKAMRE